MHPKVILEINELFNKTRGGGLTSVVQNYFDKVLCEGHTDMTAISIACPKDLKRPYYI